MCIGPRSVSNNQIIYFRIHFGDVIMSVMASQTTRTPSQYTKRRLFVRSRKVSKPRDCYFKLPFRFEI